MRAVLLCLGAACCASAPSAPLEVFVRDDAGTPLANAVVFVESAAARRAVKPMPEAVVAQRDKTFQPEVLAITTGTAVRFPNFDTVRHHVYSVSPAKRFEIKLYVGTPAAPVVFDRAGVVTLGCNIHDQMAAWIVVVDTPWFATTDGEGHAKLPDVPAGRHTLRVWQPRLGPGSTSLAQSLSMDQIPQRVEVQLGR